VTDLESRLSALRDEVAWPPTPDLAAATVARIAAEPARRARPRWLRGPRLAPALSIVLAVVVATGVLLAASPGVRARVADWLGIGAVRVERVERLPAARPAGDDLGLGRLTTREDARRATGLPVPAVAALGPPAGVYTVNTDVGTSVSLVWPARPSLPPSADGIGALLTVLPGDALPIVRKLIDPSVRVRDVRVGDAPGLFVEGRHVLVPPRRLAGNTLVWTAGAATYRLETELALDAALRIARTVR
jgi:hypothetical protein